MFKSIGTSGALNPKQKVVGNLSGESVDGLGFCMHACTDIYVVM